MLEFDHSSPSSFDATGIGFRYIYNADQNALSVSLRDQEYNIANFHFDASLSENPQDYTRFLEKACQITALMYSNNRSNNITALQQSGRLRRTVKNAAKLSRYAYDLNRHDLERFATFFADESQLESIKIKEFTSNNGMRNFFVGRVYTQNGNSISVRACTLTGLTAALSDRTLRDLMMIEFGHRFEGSAQNLLTMASKLSSISMILDKNFVPAQKILLNSQIRDTL